MIVSSALCVAGVYFGNRERDEMVSLSSGTEEIVSVPEGFIGWKFKIPHVSGHLVSVVLNLTLPDGSVRIIASFKAPSVQDGSVVIGVEMNALQLVHGKSLVFFISYPSATWRGTQDISYVGDTVSVSHPADLAGNTGILLATAAIPSLLYITVRHEPMLLE